MRKMRVSAGKIVIGILLSMIVSLGWDINIVIPVYAADAVVVNATNVNVRSQPNTKSKSYGKVSKGTVLTRLEARSDGWSSIDYAGTTAYIKTDLLAPTSTAATATTTVTAASVAGLGISSAAVTSNQNVNNQTKQSSSYVANKNTKKFHYASCSSVSDMSEKNKLYHNGSRDELISQGYVPCKRCKP